MSGARLQRLLRYRVRAMGLFIVPESEFPRSLFYVSPSTQNVLGMKEQDAGLLKVLGPLAGDALRLSGYDKNGVSVALNPVDAKIYEVSCVWCGG